MYVITIKIKLWKPICTKNVNYTLKKLLVQETNAVQNKKNNIKLE